MLSESQVTCPFCGSRIPVGAIKCRWCGEFVTADQRISDDKLREVFRRLQTAAALVQEELERRSNAGSTFGKGVAIRVGMSVADAERALVIATLEAVGGKRDEAAKILDIGERTLYRKLNDWDAEKGAE